MPATPKHLPANERRAVTVEAVLDLSATKNPSDITTADIARHMKLTQGAIFRHFPNKEAIWQAVMEWVSERLLSRIDKAANHAQSPMEALEAIFVTHAEFVAAHPGVPRMLFGELQRSEDSMPKRLARTLIEKYSKRLVLLIEEGKSLGHIDPNIETATAASLFIGAIQGMVMQSLLTSNTDQMPGKVPEIFAIYRRAIEKRL